MNEKITMFIIFGLILFSAGCCPRATVPATVQADINRLRVYNQRLESENEYLKGKFSELTGAVEGYSSGVSEIAGESISDLDRLQYNNIWLGNFIQGLITELSERGNEPEAGTLVGHD